MRDQDMPIDYEKIKDWLEFIETLISVLSFCFTGILFIVSLFSKNTDKPYSGLFDIIGLTMLYPILKYGLIFILIIEILILISKAISIKHLKDSHSSMRLIKFPAIILILLIITLCILWFVPFITMNSYTNDEVSENEGLSGVVNLPAGSSLWVVVYSFNTRTYYIQNEEPLTPYFDTWNIPITIGNSVTPSQSKFKILAIFADDSASNQLYKDYNSPYGVSKLPKGAVVANFMEVQRQ
jgi:hypothetical protein